LIQAILESEDRSEQQLSELALAIFLIGTRHRLSPADYQHLLTFEPNSPELADSRAAFHDLASDHIEQLGERGFLHRPMRSNKSTTSVLTGLLGWLRHFWPIRACYPSSRKSEILS